MKRISPPRHLSFPSRLERLAPGINYFALSVPAKITAALQTRGPVAVTARVNDSPPFLVSLHPVGGGRHKLRVKAEIRHATGIKAGDRVRVRIEVIDPAAEISLPADLAAALRAAGVLESFHTLPRGRLRYALRLIDAVARPETRARRIQDAVKLARERKLSR